jgi:hypothetical protein
MSMHSVAELTEELTMMVLVTIIEAVTPTMLEPIVIEVIAGEFIEVVESIPLTKVEEFAIELKIILQIAKQLDLLLEIDLQLTVLALAVG